MDASVSINPLGPPAWLRQELSRWTSTLVHYPDPECRELSQRISDQHACSPEQVVVGNGTSELIAWLPYALDHHRRWVVPVPSYGEYRRAPALAGRQVVAPALSAAPGFAVEWHRLEEELCQPAVVVLGHPNNPTGKLLELSRFERLRKEHPQSLFVVDEAFGELADGFQSAWDVAAENLVVLRSLTKIAAIPGLRLGYALASPSTASELRRRLPPWTVNLLAQRVGIRYFEDPDFLQCTRREVKRLRSHLATELGKLRGIEIHEPPTNWLLVRLVSGSLTASVLARECRARGVAVRVCDDFPGLEDGWLRVSVRPEDENSVILQAFEAVCGRAAEAPSRAGPSSVCPPARRWLGPLPKAIMLQGCSSDAGKSVLVTALCRCLLQDGYRVAPFKAQNMSNNSGIGRDGGEIGRAQIVQALACGLDADTRMNPVLLKPTSDRGAQVVVRGRAIGHRDVQGYLATRERCFEAALQAFDELGQEYEVIVCEGAGSAGEMNLRAADMVNMGFIARREMPALLVGDIDRGGVYAGFVGHLEVMSEADRARVRGFLVNRFRGDPDLLTEAHSWVEYQTGRPILGVVPYLPDLRLPGEDRLSLTSGRRSWGPLDAPIVVAAVAGPHVSNATDMDPFTLEEDVHLRLVERPEELGRPDVILWLGTKNTLGDLAHFRHSGMAEAILCAHRAGSEVVGICGGLQMLGEAICDPEGVEAGSDGASGLGLLPLATRFRGEKVLRRCSARHLPSGLTIEGYEIHHGATDFAAVDPLLVDETGKVVGGGLPAQRVWGTYLHGLFESDRFRRHYLDQLRQRKGLGPHRGPERRLEPEATLDLLAGVFRQHVDWRRIYRLMGLSV